MHFIIAARLTIVIDLTHIVRLLANVTTKISLKFVLIKLIYE